MAELTRLLKSAIDRLDAAGMHTAADELREVGSAAYTTSSEWLGELGLTIRRIQDGPSLDPIIVADLDRIMQQVRRVWPNL